MIKLLINNNLKIVFEFLFNKMDYTITKVLLLLFG